MKNHKAFVLLFFLVFPSLFFAQLPMDSVWGEWRIPWGKQRSPSDMFLTTYKINISSLKPRELSNIYKKVLKAGFENRMKDDYKIRRKHIQWVKIKGISSIPPFDTTTYYGLLDKKETLLYYPMTTENDNEWCRILNLTSQTKYNQFERIYKIEKYDEVIQNQNYATYSFLNGHPQSVKTNRLKLNAEPKVNYCSYSEDESSKVSETKWFSPNGTLDSIHFESNTKPVNLLREVDMNYIYSIPDIKSQYCNTINDIEVKKFNDSIIEFNYDSVSKERYILSENLFPIELNLSSSFKGFHGRHKWKFVYREGNLVEFRYLMTQYKDSYYYYIEYYIYRKIDDHGNWIERDVRRITPDHDIMYLMSEDINERMYREKREIIYYN